MKVINEYIADVKRLEKTKRELEDVIRNKLGHCVNVHYWSNSDEYVFLTHSYKGLLDIAKMLKIGTDIVHEDNYDENFKHRFSITGKYMGENVEVSCILTEEEYKRECGA